MQIVRTLKNHAPPVYTVLNVIYVLKICQQITGGLEIVIPKKGNKGLKSLKYRQTIRLKSGI